MNEASFTRIDFACPAAQWVDEYKHMWNGNRVIILNFVNKLNFMIKEKLKNQDIL